MSISNYHDKNDTYFVIKYRVKLSNETIVEVETLRIGVTIWTSKDVRKIATIVKTTVANKKMYQLENLVITP